MMTREEARRLTAKAIAFSTFPECEVQISETETLNLRFANNGITTSGLALERSLVVRSTRDARTGVSSADQTDDEAIRATVRRSEELAALAPPNAEHVPPLGPQEYPSLDHFDEATAASRSPALVPHVRAVLDRAVKDKLVAAGFFIRTADARSVANKAGLFGFGRYTDSRLSTTFRAPDGSSSGWAGQPAVRLKDIDGAALAARAAGKCLRWKKPARLEPGKYTVVLEPTATSDLVRMANMALSARAAEEGRSYFSRKDGGTALGEKLFPEFVTLRSDPADPRMPGVPWTFDLLPASAVTWVEKGVLKNLAYDRFWAAKAGKQPVMPGGTMILEGGTSSVEELVKSVDRGLLVTRFWYIRVVNPRTVQLTGLTRDGLFLIEKGQIAGAAVNFRFNESPMRLLENARKMGRVERVTGGEGGGMVAPAMLAADFNFTSISDAV